MDKTEIKQQDDMPTAEQLLLEVFKNFKTRAGYPGKYQIHNDFRNYREYLEPMIKKVLKIDQ